MALVVLHKPADELMANTIRDLLVQNGIPAMVRSYQVPAYDGIARMMRPNWGEILVDEQDLDQARELVGGFLAAGEQGVTDE